MTQVCTPVVVSGQSCVQCTEQPFIAAVPSQTITDPQHGWNSSAYSSQQIAGDCYTQFTVPQSVGVVCGFAPERLSSDPRDLPFGFYCYQEGGRYLWAVVEGFVQKTTPVAWAAGSDEFRVERRAGAVSYFVNGRYVYASLNPMQTPLRVVACMYAATDGVN